MSTAAKPKTLDEILVEFAQHRKLMQDELQKVIIGQNEVIEQLFAAIFTRGHCLLEGVPGLAKTLMVSTLAKILDVGFINPCCDHGYSWCFFSCKMFAVI